MLKALIIVTNRSVTIFKMAVISQDNTILNVAITK